MPKKHSTPLSETDPLHLAIQKTTYWLHEYFKYILILLCLAFLAGAGFLIYNYQEKYINQKAENELYAVKKTLMDLEKGSGGNVLSASENTFFKKLQKSKYSPEIENTVKQYQELIKKWKHTASGLLSAIELSHFLYQYDEKKEQAISLLQFVLDSYKGKSLGYLLASYQLGLYFADQKKYNSAITYFDFIVQSKNNSWLRSEALLNKALIYEKQNKMAQAESIYKEIKISYADEQAGQLAAQYLNLMTLESKLKEKGERE